MRLTSPDLTTGLKGSNTLIDFTRPKVRWETYSRLSIMVSTPLSEQLIYDAQKAEIERPPEISPLWIQHER
jgi:hypothetical protein